MSIENLQSGMPDGNRGLRHPTSPPGEGGMALIIALSLLVLVGLLVASASSVSQLTRNIAATATSRSELGYIAEGVAARAQWLLMNDINKNRNRIYGESTKDELSDVERYLADGATHTLSYAEDCSGKAVITDAASGVDISGKDGPTKLKTAWSPEKEDLEEYNKFIDFIDCLIDYVDTDDFLQVSGKGHEKGDYLQDGFPCMPRNGTMQFREELMLVHDSDKYIKPDSFGRLTSIRLIPLEGMDPINATEDSIITADRATLKRKGGLSDAEVDLVIKARDLWIKEGIPFSESLDIALYQKVKSKLSFKESGTYTIRIEVADQQIVRTLFLTVKTSFLMPSSGNKYYEWALY